MEVCDVSPWRWQGHARCRKCKLCAALLVLQSAPFGSVSATRRFHLQRAPLGINPIIEITIVIPAKTGIHSSEFPGQPINESRLSPGWRYLYFETNNTLTRTTITRFTVTSCRSPSPWRYTCLSYPDPSRWCRAAWRSAWRGSRRWSFRRCRRSRAANRRRHRPSASRNPADG
jgi:hypothetical protein